MELVNKLKELASIPGISGYEDQVKEKLREWLKPYTDVKEDRIGNLIVEAGSGDERIVFMAHVDEIGLLITGITPDGKLTFRKIGGIDDRLLYGRHVDVITENGKIDGVIGAIPPHLNIEGRSDTVPWHQLTIDIGAENRNEAADLGVKALDFAVFKKHFSILNGRYVSCRSLDDRFGAVVLFEVIRRIFTENLEPGLNGKIVFAFTVQEENGLKGARFLANSYSPDYAIAIDSFGCCNLLTGDVRPGQGPVIRAVDNSAIYSRKLALRVRDIATKADIPVQVGTTGGGTDSSAFEHKSEILTLSAPIKYLHSEVEMMNLKDIEALANLLTLVALKL
ncbi:M42 family metallopeptidase [Geoglobus acetivorans]|uniref:Deblocking aminopeptidase n=1 Tax=Geoglobus acetivorans TaxID=565033 RepID=A0A0A7GE85_GEOAI|nr:Deblocking aminopeptidase [Geoglobus acetivorans]